MDNVFIILDHVYSNGLQFLLDKIRNIPSCKTIVFSFVYDRYGHLIFSGDFNTLFEPIFKNLKHNYVLILDSCFHTNFNQHISIVDHKKIIYVNYFAMEAVYISVVNQFQNRNLQWNSESQKALFLTGKANKPHRIGLLARFYKNQLMENLVWSLFLNNEIKQRCYEFIKDISINYEKFFSECQINPDNINMWYSNNQNTPYSDTNVPTTHYDGYPYDVQIYKNTCLSIISETYYFEWNYPDICSEKTYRAILNKHPFIMVAKPNTCSNLKKIGFRTFENYMLIKNYDEYLDDVRINTVVPNTTYFLQNFKKDKVAINEDVEHNYNNLIAIGKQDLSKIEEYGIAEELILSRCKLLQKH